MLKLSNKKYINIYVKFSNIIQSNNSFMRNIKQQTKNNMKISIDLTSFFASTFSVFIFY
jgi:hypothetical protein